jgi:hypothetical protein
MADRPDSLNENGLSECVVVIRRLAVYVIACVSLFAALGLVWLLIRPEHIHRAGTPILLTVFGLLLLPGLSWAGWRLDTTPRSA